MDRAEKILAIIRRRKAEWRREEEASARRRAIREYLQKRKGA